MIKIIRRKTMAIVLALAMVVSLPPALTMAGSTDVTYYSTNFLSPSSNRLTDGHFVVTGKDENGSELLCSDEYGIALLNAEGNYSEAATGVINIASANSGDVFTMSSITVNVCRKFTFAITYGSADTPATTVTVDPNDEDSYDSNQKILGLLWYYKTITLEPQMADAVHITMSSKDVVITEQQVGTSTSIVGFTAEGYPGTPSTVTTGSVTDAASTSATMSGNVTDAGSAVVTDRGVVYSATDETPMIGETGVTQDANGTGTGSFSNSITGLTPSETYYVRAYATNSVGTSYGSVVNFTTGAANTAPTFVDSDSGSLTVAKNAGATDITSLLHVSDSDSTQTLTWSESSAPTHGTLNVGSVTASSGSTNITPGGTITYMPNTDYSGDDSFTVQVSDGTATATRTINVTVDGIAPTVSSVSVPSNGTYKMGETLSFTVNFSEAVTVVTTGGMPYLSLTFDTGGTVHAPYVSGSGKSALVFSYTVASDDFDADGISLGSIITANGGTLKDAVGNDADLQLNSVGSTTSVKIDAAAPTVSSVLVPSNGTYKMGETLSFTVNFSEAVTVVTTGGTPYIPVTLDTGGTVNASYASGSGTLALVFSYTVASGNLDADGIAVGSSITANGGTLRDAVGNDAILALSVGSTAGVLVDAIAPAVSSIERSIPAFAATNAASVTFRVTFDEAVSGVDTTDFSLDTTGTASGTIASVSAASGTTFDVTVNSISGVGIIRLDLNSSGTGITDGAGNAISGGYTSGQTYTIDAVAPTASVTTQTVAAGVNVTVRSTETGTVYLIDNTLDSTAYDAVSKLEALVSGSSATKISISAANTDTTTTVPSLSGAYAAVAVDLSGNISQKSANLVTVDAAAPTASVTTQTVAAGVNVTVRSTETGTVYLIDDTLDSTAYDAVSKLDALVSAGSATKVLISAANTDTTITAPSSPGAYAALAVDDVDNISLKTANLVTVDATAPTITGVVRTDNTHIAVKLSEACRDLEKANDGGFSVKETDGTSVYMVSATAQGPDSSHVVLTVADMAAAGASGVTVTYTAGGNGAIADTAGNALLTDAPGKAIAAWDIIAPTILSATRNSDTQITVMLSEACQNLSKANNGGFTVTKTGTGTTYAVSATAQGTDSSHVVLAVANMSSAGSVGVTVTYTAGGKGTIADTAGNILATNSTGTVITAWVTSEGVSSSSSLSNNGAAVIVNGEFKTAGTSQTITNSSGQTVTTVTVDSNKLESILASESSGTTVTIPITGNTDIAMGTLTGAMVKSMENKDATLVVQTDSGTYTLPASEINIDAISQQLGTSVALSDIKVTVSISEPSASMTKVIESAAQDSGFTIMVPAVNYTITCTHGSQTIDVSSFNAYVERTIAIPDGVDPTKITTGVVVKPDGTTHHVPTRVTVINGKYYAVINSLTNSTYSIVWNPIEFSDVANHWAKDAINNMGSRMIVTGVGNNDYAPDRNMTRAEFATIMVRALGLEPETGASGFGDVAATDWCSGYIKTAVSYGLIKGYDNGNFGPNDTITREQAMTIVAKAMKITGLTVSMNDNDISTLLGAYADGASTSDYSTGSIAACLETGIITGTSTTTITPKNDITRAEVAVMIQNLLQKSDLI